MKPRYGLFTGRFQPLHNAHLKCMLKILEEVENLVVGIVNPDPKDTIEFREFTQEKNPFTFWERYRMVHESLEEVGTDMSRVYIVPFYPPLLYADDKTERFVPKSNVTVYIPAKDEFDRQKIEEMNKRGWDVRALEVTEDMSSTEIRRRIYTGEEWESLVPEAVAKIIKEVDGINRIKGMGK